MEFGIRVCKHVKSNAIAFVTEDRTLAVGGGATSRIDPVYAAREKAARLKVSLQGSVLVSEALFPFPDGPTLAAEAGATAIAQPGGAVRDNEVIAAADAYGLAMVFTGRPPLPPLNGRESGSAMKVLVSSERVRASTRCAGGFIRASRYGELFCAGGNPGNRPARATGEHRSRTISPALVAFVNGEQNRSHHRRSRGSDGGGNRRRIRNERGCESSVLRRRPRNSRASKAFAKSVMREAGVPTANFQVFDDARGGARVCEKPRRPGRGEGRRPRARQGRRRVPTTSRPRYAAIADAMESRKFRRGRRARRDRGTCCMARSFPSSRCATATTRLAFGLCAGSQGHLRRRHAAPTPAGWARTRRSRNFPRRWKSA